MKSERIINALSRADDKYVEEAMPTRAAKNAYSEAEAVKAEPVTVTAPKRKIYGRGIAAAACACVAVGGLVLWGAVGGADSLTENGAGEGTGSEEYAQTGSPELNGYHNFYLTMEELNNCALSCFIPRELPPGYQFSEEVHCVEANGLKDTVMDMELLLWFSSGIDDPETTGYNPIYFGITAGDKSRAETDYQLQSLHISDIAEWDKGAVIDCGNDVTIQISYPYPELLPAEAVYNMIMSMPYTDQWAIHNSTYQIEYLTRDQVYGSLFGAYLPTVMPNGYYIAGLSPYTYTENSVNGNSTISLYINNGVEDTSLPTYCPIRYTVQSHGNGTDTSGKPVYLDIGKLTLENVEEAMEYGGFFTTYTDTDLIEVSFPYPDRVSPQEIYTMMKSVPVASEYSAETTVEHTVVYLSQQELYSGMWTMYMPRKLPYGYRLAENTVFAPSEFADAGTMYLEFTDGKFPIHYTIYADPLLYDTLGAGAEFFTRDMGIDNIHLLKENGWVDCNNATVKIKLDFANPDLISDEELYAFIMSVPFFDNIAASGLDTTSLDSRIYTGLPEVNFDTYYNAERYTLSGDVFETAGDIIGFDGTYVYFNKWEHTDENHQALHESQLITRIGWYNVKTGETGLLPEEGYKGILSYIYSDGEFVYCSKETVVDEDYFKGLMYSGVVRYNIKTGKEDVILDLGKDAWLLDEPTVNGSSMFMYVQFLNEVATKLVCYDMTSGVFGTGAKSVNDLPSSAFTYTETDEISYSVTLPYKDGVLYMMPGSQTPDFIAPSCILYYWNGRSLPAPLFEARLDDLIDVEKGNLLCFSDGETVYFVRKTYANGADDTAGMQDTLFAFDLSDAFTRFGTHMEHSLANNKNPTDSPYHKWHATATSCAGGMVAIDPYSGLIYDAENGWFTYVNTNVYYRAINSVCDSMAMLEFADVEYDINVDFVDYPEGGKDLTLCVITRK